MSDPSDLPPEPIVLHHYGEEGDPPALPHPDESLQPQDEAQKAINVMVAREARELIKHADPRVRAAAVFQLAPHEAPFLLGDPEPVARLAAVRVCAAFPLLRVLLIDLKLDRRDASAEVRWEVAALLGEDAAEVRRRLPTWATEALVASPLFDDEEPAEGLDHPRLRVLPSGSARERGTSASWASREVLDRPVEEVVPSQRMGDSCEGIKKVAHVHDANRQSWTSREVLASVVPEGVEVVPPAPHGPAEGAWDDGEPDQASNLSEDTRASTDPIRAMTDKEST